MAKYLVVSIDHDCGRTEKLTAGPTPSRQPLVAPQHRYMIGLYSNRLGCLGSIVISVLATLLVALLLRGCGIVAW